MCPADCCVFLIDPIDEVPQEQRSGAGPGVLSTGLQCRNGLVNRMKEILLGHRNARTLQRSALLP